MGEKRRDDEAAISPSDDASIASSADIDIKTDKALMRKLDRNIIPFIVVMYLFSFLDRGWCPDCRPIWYWITVLTLFCRSEHRKCPTIRSGGRSWADG